ncbi:MAG: hypothetical protein ACTSPB_00270 [Candidatus Thorarchaeota archaeon]
MSDGLPNWGDVVIEMMRQEGVEHVGYDTYGLLDEIAHRYCELTGRCKVYKMHPLDRHIAVLNRLEKDDRFVKSLFRCTDGRSERLVRSFRLKENKDGDVV